MAEIKSTLELAMERTKKIAISKQEREEIKQKEVFQKVESLFHRYREGHLPLNEILKEIERMEENVATTVKEILLSRWIDALSLDDEDEKLLRGIESLLGRDLDEMRRKLLHLHSRYREGKKKIQREMEAQLLESLKREGIHGNAIEPNIEKSQDWKKELDKWSHLYREKLEEIKNQLRIL